MSRIPIARISYSVQANCLFVEDINAPGYFQMALDRLAEKARENGRDRLCGIVWKRSRLRLFRRKGWTLLVPMTYDRYLIEYKLCRDSSTPQP